MQCVMNVLLIALLSLGSVAQAAQELSLVPLSQGLARAPSARAMLATESASISGPDFSEAAARALPDAVASYRDGNLFYAFFDLYRDPDSDRAYAIQRVRKTSTTYRSRSDTHPEVSVEYLVEVFKTSGGALKRADLHHGSYSIGGAFRRVILKEAEVGTGEIPNEAAGNSWPYEPGTLYHLVANYGADHGAYDSVRFDRSLSWRIQAELASDGSYEVSSPELRLELGSGR
jgi:hypothetical protein